MKALRVAACLAALVAGSVAGTTRAATIADFESGIGPSANHPYPTSSFGTWYDITSDAFATPATGTLDGSPAFRSNDGGFTNGLYIIYEAVVPTAGLYTLSANMKVMEDPAAPNAIRAYQMGAVVNGVHRVDHPTDPDDLATIDPNAPGSGVASYSGLTIGDDSGLPTQLLTTDEFFANAGDHLLVAFSTDLTTGNFDDNSGTWGAAGLNHVLVDNLTLNVVPEPASLGVLAVGMLGLLRRRRA